MEYRTIANSMQRCTACSFASAEFAPLPPQPIQGSAPLMFIGESPSWAERQIAPFSPETISGAALERHYLAPLGLRRDQVWITNLLKCRYPAGIYGNKTEHDAEIQRSVETCVRLWLLRELDLVQPRIIVTLSDSQVCRRLREMFGLTLPAAFEEAVGRPHEVTLGSHSVILFPMIHPEISRPVGDGDGRRLHARRQWASLHHSQHLPALKVLLETVGVFQ